MDKAEVIERLVNRYGENFKTPLARDLRVDVSTIRRLFNSPEELPFLYEKAIEALLSEMP
jgi:hypothetical protein